jgi:hypothetical protein
MSRTLTYAAKLDAAAATGDARARDYVDACVEHPGEASHTVAVVGALATPVNWGDTSNGTEPVVIARSR